MQQYITEIHEKMRAKSVSINSHQKKKECKYKWYE